MILQNLSLMLALSWQDLVVDQVLHVVEMLYVRIGSTYVTDKTRILRFAFVYFHLAWWRAATERPDELAERVNR